MDVFKVHGYHRSGKSWRKKIFIIVREKSGNFTVSRGKFRYLQSQGRVKYQENVILVTKGIIVTGLFQL